MNGTPMLWLEAALGRVVHAGWQAAVLGLVVVAVSRLPRRHLSAGWRLGLWLVVLVRFALPVVPAMPWALWRSAVPVPGRLPGYPGEGLPLPAPEPGPDDPAVVRALPPDGGGLPASSEKPDEVVAVASAELPVPWLALGWLAGMLLLLGRLGWLGWRLAWRRRTWRLVSDTRARALLEECRRELGMRRPVALVTAGGGVGPATCGVFRACVVLPEALVARFARDELRLVLLHELMHVRRWDVLVDRVAACLVAVHWFNPVAWLLRRALRRERELACDAAVLDRVGPAGAGAYGRVLLRVVEQMRPAAAGAGVVGVFGQDVALKRRIHVIANYHKPTAAQVVLGCALLVPLAAFGLTDAGAGRPAREVADRETPVVAPTEALTLTGVCQDEDGRPLKGIKVVLYRVDYKNQAKKSAGETTSDAEGRFRFAGLQPLPREGEWAGWFYALVVIAQGRASTIRWLQDEKAAADVTVSMPPAATLRGRVTDPNGKPVAGAAVWVQGLRSGPLEGVMSAHTDADGRYSITDLRAWDVAKQKPHDLGNGTVSMVSECFFRVRHPDYAQERPGYKRIPDTINVTLQPAGVIAGRVVDEVTGKPAAGVAVFMQGTDDNYRGSGGETRTDADGNYRLTSVRAGRYNLWADAPDRACAALDPSRSWPGRPSTPPTCA